MDKNRLVRKLLKAKTGKEEKMVRANGSNKKGKQKKLAEWEIITYILAASLIRSRVDILAK